MVTLIFMEKRNTNLSCFVPCRQSSVSAVNCVDWMRTIGLPLREEGLHCAGLLLCSWLSSAPCLLSSVSDQTHWDSVHHHYKRWNPVCSLYIKISLYLFILYLTWKFPLRLTYCSSEPWSRQQHPYSIHMRHNTT